MPAISSLSARVVNTVREYPGRFWVLVGATFIDRVGGTLVFPFFTLYVTRRFRVGMTEAGLIFGLFALSSFLGNMVGGGLTDRFGRRAIVLFGLAFSALSTISLGLAPSLTVMFPLVIAAGLLADIAGPARMAMVADLLSEEQRADGYGIMRVVGNLAWIIGPTLAGLLVARSYLLLFVLDAITSLITAFIVYRMIPETMPVIAEADRSTGLGATFRGYAVVLRDRAFAAFVGISMVMNVVYIQLYSSLSVYLRDVHSLPERGYGLLMSLNALTVVLTQIWLTRRTRAYPPLLVMAAGSALYLVGFSMYGFVATFPLFVLAMVIITVGEMLVIPVSQALVALFAPVEMRGRYMASFSLSWGVPSAIAPWAAGLVIDNLNPHLLWAFTGILSAAATVGFLALHSRQRDRLVAKRRKASSSASAATIQSSD